MTTGEKITNCRKELGLTQNELAELLSVSRQAVSRWESDAAFPETEKLLKMSKLFSCSVDWLLKYDEEERGEVGEAEEKEKNNNSTLGNLKNWHFEYKSKKNVGKLPLVHINIGIGRTAEGFFAVGIKAKGVFSLGVFTVGIFSCGVFALGLLTLATLGLGILSLGAFALGILSAGGISVGIISVGGVALGLFSLGGCAVGCFAFGGIAHGSYIAIGDYAFGGIALGGTRAVGSVYSALFPQFEENAGQIYSMFDNLPSSFIVFINWCKSLFNGVLNGTITLGG